MDRKKLLRYSMLLIAASLLLPFFLVKPSGQELPPMRSRGEPGIVNVRVNAEKVPLYGKFELTTDVSASYDNPFDPDEIDLSAEFTTPSGRKIVVSGFFYQAYHNRNEGDDSKTPVLDAVGKPCWKVRFTPTEIGVYSYVLTLRNGFSGESADVKTKPGNFSAVESTNPGFIRISPKNNRYFQFDDGASFFVIGQNLQQDWMSYGHIRMLSENGCNAARVWLCHFMWLEWTFKPFDWAGPGHHMRSYAGLGRYNQRVAWILDNTLDRCELTGLRLMICLGNALTELSSGDYDSWGGNPYNKANGGFLDDPQKFWTDQRARELYKQRLRYIVARWGYSPNVWAWEFWNELGRATTEVVAWHKEMAEYLRAIDPNRHLITTSTWWIVPEAFDPIWRLPEIGFTQTHSYIPSQALSARAALHLNRYVKPHIVGEGGGHGDSDVEFHNSLWVAPMSGAAGTTLPWWWRELIEPRNLFFHYKAVAMFLKDIPWADNRFQPIQIESVSPISVGDERRFSPVLIVPLGSGWDKLAPIRSSFVVEPNGTVPHIEEFDIFLFGGGRAGWRHPCTIDVNFPEPGRLVINVDEASRGILEVYLDGKLVLHEESLNVPRTQIRKDFFVDVPAGYHKIKLDNAGSDWIRIGHLILTNYRDTQRYPDLDIYGVQSDTMALLWIHNRLNQWAFKSIGIASNPTGLVNATIKGLKDGHYAVEWWDTYKGTITKSEEVVVSNGKLQLLIPPIQDDVACKIKCISFVEDP